MRCRTSKIKSYLIMYHMTLVCVVGATDKLQNPDMGSSGFCQNSGFLAASGVILEIHLNLLRTC